ncbi:MAG: acetylxylan esterase [Armatimonadota bacterium]
MRSIQIGLLLCALMIWGAIEAIGAEALLPGISIFPERERTAMLKAYHARMSAPQPITVTNLADWEKRKAMLRQRNLAGFGLDPLPPDVPLNLTYGDKIERDDCTITRVRFQTFPGVYSLGFLYMPKGLTAPAPAVFHPHGHWANWSADDIVQSRCIGLAKRGYISLAVQYEHFEDINAGLTQRGVFLWNNMRGVSVLQSLPQVDKARIGATGASGGGQQSMDLAAYDDRVKAVAIGVYPTYYSRILYIHVSGCSCNYAPIGALTYTDQQEYVALIAPKPAIVFSVTGDWTAPSIDAEMREVAGVFDLFTNPAGPTVAHIDEGTHRIFSSKNGRFLIERWPGPHDYTKAMRERMYWWMDWWLKGKQTPQPEPEVDLKLEKPAALQALRCQAPEAIQWSDSNLAAILRPGRVVAPPALTSKAEVATFQTKLRTALTDILGEKGMRYGTKREAVSLGTERLGDWTVEKLWYASEPDARIPAFFIPAKAAKAPAAILLLPNGKNDILVDPYRAACQGLLDAGRSVLVIDQRLRGEWAYAPVAPGNMPGYTWYGNGRVWGRPETGMAVCDVRAAIDSLAGRADCTLDTLQVVGLGAGAGMDVLCAAALDERIKEVVCDLDYADFSQGARVTVIPRILRHGDVGEVAALVAPRKLRLLNVNPRTSLATVESAYKLTDAAKQLTFECTEEGGNREAPLVNGGFEDGIRGWSSEGEQPVSLSTTRADLGKTALKILPGQTVLSDPVPVKPGLEYRLYLHLSKPASPQLDVFLVRGESRYTLFNDWYDRLRFEEQAYDFLARPGERSVRIGFRRAAGKADASEALVDTVRLVEGNALKIPKPDGRELMTITSSEGLPAGPLTFQSQRAAGKWLMLYGPGAACEIVAAGKDGRPAIHLTSGSAKAYATLSALLREPLKRGYLYRLTVTARGSGNFGLNFWDMPNFLSPRGQWEITGEWKNYTLDLFVESEKQCRALPTVNITGDIFVDRMSLQQIALPQ